MELNLKGKKVLIYAEGFFSKRERKEKAFTAKTADGVLYYAPYPIVGVVDSTAKEKRVGEVLPYIKRFARRRLARADVPIVKSLAEGLKFKPDILLLGIAPEGGELPNQWRKDIIFALENKLDVVSGLHFMLNGDKELRELANFKRVRIFDVRCPPKDLPVASARAFELKIPIVLTVGMDAAIGKLTVSLELNKLALESGVRSAFIATGQTGIMIAGKGYSIDACVGDFMPAAMEKLVLDYAREGYQMLFVEGQGSLFHPGFSNTTIAIIHGCVPTHMILVARPQRKYSLGSKYVKLPPLLEAIQLHEDMVLPKERKAKVVGVALNTKGLSEKRALEEVKKAQEETGLPATDVLRFGSENLFEAIMGD